MIGRIGIDWPPVELSSMKENKPLPRSFLFLLEENSMGDYTEIFLEEMRVKIVDSYLSIIPLEYALAAVNMTEEEYNRIKAEIENHGI